ncbi:hypothetical protein V496_02463 [Pseudogymnoascus sp. VKM F-4515 (FW-2607)]|nr:hypothetical protein V496_02463 [Pseudogymnoascus sp. VKM F-4515 (FW-2607)]
MSSLTKTWSKPQLFICQNPRTLMIKGSTISHFASAMEKESEIFIADTTGDLFFNNHGIVHLYQTGESWMPTMGTQLENPGDELWWGILIQSNKSPQIADLRSHKADDDLPQSSGVVNLAVVGELCCAIKRRDGDDANTAEGVDVPRVANVPAFSTDTPGNTHLVADTLDGWKGLKRHLGRPNDVKRNEAKELKPILSLAWPQYEIPDDLAVSHTTKTAENYGVTIDLLKRLTAESLEIFGSLRSGFRAGPSKSSTGGSAGLRTPQHKEGDLLLTNIASDQIFDVEDTVGDDIEDELGLVALAKLSNHSYHTFNHAYAGTKTLTMNTLLHRSYRASESWRTFFRLDQKKPLSRQCSPAPSLEPRWTYSVASSSIDFPPPLVQFTYALPPTQHKPPIQIPFFAVRHTGKIRAIPYGLKGALALKLLKSLPLPFATEPGCRANEIETVKLVLRVKTREFAWEMEDRSDLKWLNRARMPQDERIGVGAAFQRRHLRVYTFLCQLIITIVTFYCAIAISCYGPSDPTPASAVPGAAALRTLLSDANSTTPHICSSGTSEDIVYLGAVLVTLTPYSVLCPSTPFFLLCLISFLFGIFIFNSLHTEDLDLAEGYSYFIIAALISIDWQNVLARRLQAEEMWKILGGRGERVGDVETRGEAGEGGDVEEGINEETPLRRDDISPISHPTREFHGLEVLDAANGNLETAEYGVRVIADIENGFWDGWDSRTVLRKPSCFSQPSGRLPRLTWTIESLPWSITLHEAERNHVIQPRAAEGPFDTVEDGLSYIFNHHKKIVLEISRGRRRKSASLPCCITFDT